MVLKHFVYTHFESVTWPSFINRDSVLIELYPPPLSLFLFILSLSFFVILSQFTYIYIYIYIWIRKYIARFVVL